MIASQYFTLEFLETAGKLLAAMAYANFAEEHPDLDIQRASHGSDWMDAVPADNPWWVFAYDVAIHAAAFPEQRDKDGKLLFTNGIIGIVASTILHNVKMPWDPVNPDYEKLDRVYVPAGRGMRRAVEFTASSYAHKMVGTGCGIEDAGWDWPKSVAEHLKSAHLELDYEAAFPGFGGPPPFPGACR